MIDTDYELLEEIKVDEDKDNTSKLILCNDDVNTFDWVIECLMLICGHSETQATQCAYIVHTKGKCIIKEGKYDDLQPYKTALLNRHLTVIIEK